MKKAYLVGFCLSLLAGATFAQVAPPAGMDHNAMMGAPGDMPPPDGRPGHMERMGHENMSKEQFVRMKEDMLRRHEKHIHVLQEGKVCIQAAQTPPALKQCMEAQHQKMEADKAEMRDHMREMRGGFEQRGPADGPRVQPLR